MTTIKLISTIFILALFWACNNPADSSSIPKYKDHKQIPFSDSASPILSYIAPDSVLSGQQYCAKIWVTSKQQKVIESYAECDFKHSLVDTTKRTLDNCRYKIVVLNDTAHFCMHPLASKTNYSFKVAVLTIDENKNYHLNSLDLKFCTK